MSQSKFQTIKFVDKGQDFLEWVTRDGIVIDSQPFQFRIWAGREVVVFGRTAWLKIPDTDLATPLRYKVLSIEDTNSDYVSGFTDYQSKTLDEVKNTTSEQYRAGYNTAKNQPATTCKSASIEPIKVRCQDKRGTYITNRVQGKQASCTAGPEHAVRALGHKLLPDQSFNVCPLDGENWLITPATRND